MRWDYKGWNYQLLIYHEGRRFIGITLNRSKHIKYGNPYMPYNEGHYTQVLLTI